jgi:hypothetical protein
MDPKGIRAPDYGAVRTEVKGQTPGATLTRRKARVSCRLRLPGLTCPPPLLGQRVCRSRTVPGALTSSNAHPVRLRFVGHNAAQRDLPVEKRSMGGWRAPPAQPAEFAKGKICATGITK